MATLIMSLLTVVVSHMSVTVTAPGPGRHIRPLTPGAAALIAVATDRAPIVKSLLEALEPTDVVVYVSHAMALSVTEPAAYLRFVSHVAGTRYLLVQVNCWGVPEDERIALLGHELQHALEVAAAPDVQDDAGLARLYRRIGFARGKQRFETLGARDTADRVREQLAGHTQ